MKKPDKKSYKKRSGESSQNYNRYKRMTRASYERKGMMDFLCRMTSDKIILPNINRIKGKKILDIGIGSGKYSKILLRSNSVTGIDKNPHLCELPIKVYPYDAATFSKHFKNEKFDVVLSTWMTEYLDLRNLESFFLNSYSVLKKKGLFISTVVSDQGIGKMYTSLATSIKGINKYSYSKGDIMKYLSRANFINIRIIRLPALLNISWAYLVIARKR